MEPVFADFSTSPAQLSNSVVTHHRCGIAPSHLALGAGGHIKVDFTVGEREEIDEAVVTVTVLGASALMDVLLNGKTLAERLAIPADGGHGDPQDTVLTAPGELLAAGDNVLEVRSPEGADTLLRLRAVTVAPTHDRDRAERAMAARAANRSVVAFSAEVRAPGSTAWQLAPRLLLHIDTGERVMPAQLSWRGADGSEAAVGLSADLSRFLGHRRTVDGAVTEYRGTLTDRWAYPEGTTGARLHRFSTEEGHDGAWFPSGELRLLLDDGGAPVERVSWTDRRGTTASVALSRVNSVGTPEVRQPVGGLRDITRTVADVEASDEFYAAGEVAENLLSKSPSKWLADGDTAELDFTLEYPAAITVYRLTSANDAPERDPEEWELQGSHDGGHWTTVDSRTREDFRQRYETKEYPVASPASYARYRLSITDNHGSEQTQLSRVQFLTAEVAAGPAHGAADFTGYRASRGGDPVGYRGTTVPGPWSDTAGRQEGQEAGQALQKLLAGDLGETARGLDDAARLVAKLAAYLKNS
ncbi:alpha-1,2-mannosidase [Streptomyces prunicolor]|uniref:Alpha-1,2-mannosidase n=1 Tax=Streptomyces prunicolor TaxID=67348 RepID=A0ABU4FBP3_9ACTN|nr:alpha-1,2-mannosidase [Streptomyces prunicolor]MDV7217999.1 alpha-1,2-mannosidase [Streptomyces prunicolor]